MNLRMQRLFGQLYREAAGDGTSGGAAGGGAVGAGAGDSAGAGAVAAAGKGEGAAGGDAGAAGSGAAGSGAGDAGKGSLLESLGKGGAAAGGEGAAAGQGDGKESTPEQKALAASEKDTRRPKDVPAKYWNAEKGEVNYEAWSKSTSELETRMRTVGLPPKTAEEYKFEVPKELKDAGVELDPGAAKAFRDLAHAQGLTQKQYEGVMGAYFQQMGAMADQTSYFSQEKAKTELLGYYKTEEAMTANVRMAFKAFNAFADEGDMAAINTLGNIPAVIRVLAKVGKEMGEDPGVNPDAILQGESLDQLMRGGPDKEDSPYWNPKDPRHAQVKAKVQRHYEAQEAARRRKAA